MNERIFPKSDCAKIAGVSFADALDGLAFHDLVVLAGPERVERFLQNRHGFFLSETSKSGVTFGEWVSTLLALDMVGATRDGISGFEGTDGGMMDFILRLDAFLLECREASDLQGLDSDPLWDAVPDRLRAIVEAARGGTR